MKELKKCAKKLKKTELENKTDIRIDTAIMEPGRRKIILHQDIFTRAMPKFALLLTCCLDGSYCVIPKIDNKTEDIVLKMY